MDVEDAEMTPYVNRTCMVGEQWFDVTHIITPPFNTPDAEKVKEALKQHGCQIEEHQDQYTLTFPEGTKKKRKGLVTLAERFMIYFPDGFKIFQHYDPSRRLSLLFIPQE